MNLRTTSRRQFLKTAAASAAGMSLATLPATRLSAADTVNKSPLFTISLAEWSLHKALFGGKLSNLDFPKTAKEEFGIDACEYVNQFFADKAQDQKYLADLKQRAADHGVTNVLVMIDLKKDGNLGEPEESKRILAVENHYPWVEAAKFLGCHSIRVNARSDAKLSYEEQKKLAIDGLRRLSEFAAPQAMNIIVENHGGLSSNGKWLAEVIQGVGLSNCGTLPDFGNFTIKPGEVYDRYQGVAEMMPYAKGVSAKSYDFDEQGNETKIDFRRILKIVLDAGYHGRVGIEYEGSRLSEPDGIRATNKLLETVRQEMSA